MTTELRIRKDDQSNYLSINNLHEAPVFGREIGPQDGRFFFAGPFTGTGSTSTGITFSYPYTGTGVLATGASIKVFTNISSPSGPISGQYALSTSAQNVTNTGFVFYVNNVGVSLTTGVFCAWYATT